MEDAMEKAETLAGTLDSSVGPPITIQEVSVITDPCSKEE